MKRVFSKFASLVVVLSITMQCPLPTVAASDKKSPGKYALLVGINEYKVRPLSGAVNDVNDFKDVLVKSFQFSDDSIHILPLLNAKATKGNIMSSFRSQLIENAKRDPEGLFIFQFSGHGIQVKDDAVKKDEADGLDEALVPFDVNGKVFKNPDQLRASLITDDELSALLTELCKETKNVIVISDCCRSGTNMRAIGRTSRHLTMKELGVDVEVAAPKQDPVHVFFDNTISDRYVAISGSDASHDSCETFQMLSDNEEKHNGLMTHHLVSLLSTSRSDITYRQLADRLRALVIKESAQNPQIEGDLDRYVFSDHGEKADPFFSVTACDGKTVTVNAGSSLGIQKGTIISFYSGTAKKFRGNDELLSSGTVKDVKPFECRVDCQGIQDTDKILQSKAVVAALESASKSGVVAIDNTKPASLSDSDWNSFLTALRSQIKETGLLILDERSEKLLNSKRIGWNFAVEVGSLHAFRTAGGALSRTNIDDGDLGLYLCRPNGPPIANTWISFSPADAAAKIVEKATIVTKQDTVRAIFNETSKLNGQVEFALWRVEKGSGKDSENWIKKECLSKSTGTPLLKVGQFVVTTVTNNSKLPLYVSMVSIASSGKIIPVYPTEGAEEQLQSGKTIDLTVCEIGPPVGQETFKIAVGTEPIKLELLKQQDSLMRSTMRSSSSKVPQLQQIILRAAGAQSRGDIGAMSSFDQDWTAASLNFRIGDGN